MSRQSLLLLIIFSACTKAAKEPAKISFHNVLILGNSITKHSKAPEIGWNGDWGMAASSREKDYVHLLQSNLQKLNTLSVVTAVNISAFERNFRDYDLSKFDTLKQLKPDLIILRIGENVEDSVAVKYNFESKYKDLVQYFKQGNNQVKILAVGSFWKKDTVEAAIKHAAQATGCSYLSLNYLTEDPSNMAFANFTDPGVGAHPGDKGMREVSRLIWDKIIENTGK